MWCLGQKQGEAVLHLVDLLFEVESGGLHAVVGGLHLRYSRLVVLAGVHKRTCRTYRLGPRLLRLLREYELLVEHQQSVVYVRYARYYLAAYGLFVVLRLGVCRLGL